MSPLSKAVEAAALHGLRMKRDPSRVVPSDFFDHSQRVRAKFAQLIGADDPNRVAIIASTSYGVATVAHNVSLTTGDNIVMLAEQFPSNVYSWRRIQQETGATLRVGQPNLGQCIDGGQTLTSEICGLIDDRTGVVAVPVVHWANGTRIDLEQVRQRCDECDALLVIDGTQSVGALPFDVETVRPDALLCSGYKWLLGPYGSGLAYLGPRFDDGIPLEENWITRAGSEHFGGLVAYTDSYQAGAIRYDVGQRSDFVNVAMLEAGLDHLLEWGVENIQQYCKALVEPAIEHIRSIGYTVETEEHRGSHLFGVLPPRGVSTDAIRQSLNVDNVNVSVRGDSLRISPNVYNDERDIEALVNALGRAL